MSLRASQEKISFLKKALIEKLEDAQELNAQAAKVSSRSQELLQLEAEVEAAERRYAQSQREQDAAKHQRTMLAKDVESLTDDLKSKQAAEVEAGKRRE